MVESVEVSENAHIHYLLILEQLKSEEVAQSQFLTLLQLLGSQSAKVTCKINKFSINFLNWLLYGSHIVAMLIKVTLWELVVTNMNVTGLSSLRWCHSVLIYNIEYTGEIIFWKLSFCFIFIPSSLKNIILEVFKLPD